MLCLAWSAARRRDRCWRMCEGCARAPLCVFCVRKSLERERGSGEKSWAREGGGGGGGDARLDERAARPPLLSSLAVRTGCSSFKQFHTFLAHAPNPHESLRKTQPTETHSTPARRAPTKICGLPSTPTNHPPPRARPLAAFARRIGPRHRIRASPLQKNAGIAGGSSLCARARRRREQEEESRC